MAQQDITDAEATYTGFVGLLKWGTVAVVILVAFIVLLIS